MTNEQKSDIIGQFLGTSEGRSRLAQSMMAPLMQRRNYAGTALQAFTEDIGLEGYPGIDPDTKSKIIMCAPLTVSTALDIYIRNDDLIIYRNRHAEDGKEILQVKLSDFEKDLEWAVTAGPEGWAQYADDKESKGLISRALLSGRLEL